MATPNARHLSGDDELAVGALTASLDNQQRQCCRSNGWQEDFSELGLG